MEQNSGRLIKLLERDGWQVVRTRGDHVTLKHAANPLIVTVPHPKKDLPKGLVRRIYSIAGWQK